MLFSTVVVFISCMVVNFCRLARLSLLKLLLQLMFLCRQLSIALLAMSKPIHFITYRACCFVA